MIAREFAVESAQTHTAAVQVSDASQSMADGASRQVAAQPATATMDWK